MTSTTSRDVVDILTEDHHEVLDLIGTIRDLEPDERRSAADTVIAELIRHSVAEEMYVYPSMRKNIPDGEKEVQHDIEEHDQLEQTMKALEGLQPADENFLVTLG